jgi:hypothetical protein
VPRTPIVHAAPPEPAAVEAAADELPPIEEAQPEPEPHYEEIPKAAAAHANGASEPMFDDLDVPPILKRDRRFVQ